MYFRLCLLLIPIALCHSLTQVLSRRNETRATIVACSQRQKDRIRNVLADIEQASIHCQTATHLQRDDPYEQERFRYWFKSYDERSHLRVRSICTAINGQTFYTLNAHEMPPEYVKVVLFTCVDVERKCGPSVAGYRPQEDNIVLVSPSQWSMAALIKALIECKSALDSFLRGGS